MTSVDRIRGLLYGHALGDAVCAYTKLRTRRALQHISEHTFTFPLTCLIPEKRDPNCLWTDDTNQLLCTIDMLHQSGGRLNVNTFFNILEDWVEHGYTEIGQTQGDDCDETTYKFVKDQNFIAIGNSQNCPLMRTVVMGCRQGRKRDIMKDCILLCKTTHCTYKSVVACCIVTSMIYDIINDVDPKHILHNASKYNPKKSKKDYKQIAKHCNVLELDELNLDDKTTDYSLKCLGVAIWAYKQRQKGNRSYQSIITEIALQGGYSDTNAAVAGAVMGAMFGVISLPTDWLQNLKHTEFLDKKVDLLKKANNMNAAYDLHSALKTAENKLSSVVL